ncbi:hypothetical protein O9992_20465 [Vibrio lentus]|nr:hypothetical protein [Vibrio lentus]
MIDTEHWPFTEVEGITFDLLESACLLHQTFGTQYTSIIGERKNTFQTKWYLW